MSPSHADTAPDWTAAAEGLQRPFAPEQIKQRKGRKDMIYSYVDARDVAERLDQVVGPNNWSFIPEVVDAEACVVRGLLTIHGITKGDIGYPNSATDAENPESEPLKAATSDALKRAAVLFGVGRHLYRDGKTGDAYGGTGTTVTRKATGERDAISERKAGFLKKLLSDNGFAIPSGVDDLHWQTANRWIDALQKDGPAAVLADPETGERLESSVERAESSDHGWEESYRSSPPKASAYKAASANQLATIAKLSRLIGKSDELMSSEMTSAEASEVITTLSREYNEQKGSASRRGA